MWRAIVLGEQIVVKDEPDDAQESSNHPLVAADETSPNEPASNLEFDLEAIRNLHYVDNTAALERAVDTGLKLAREIAPVVDQLASLDTSSTAKIDDGLRWQKSINEIFSLAIPTQTNIGVVGATGSGKSSLVNALLAEEDCSRACTAWVTEVSYNYSKDIAASYRAEIVFVSSETWLSEMGSLLQSIKSCIVSGSSDHLNPNSDAGKALLRLSAVYPSLTPETVLTSDKNALIKDTDVRKVLGRTISLTDSSAKGLSSQMETYIGRNSQEDGSKNINPWPLINVVRIFTKASALTTGAVIVDLPGLHDSNIARQAVALNYIKDCSGIWVVAPILRAVDEKSAKDLMGDSFRRQMIFDGMYSSMSFIGSKTDDINVNEAAAELGLATDIKRDFARIDAINNEISALQTELDALKERKAADRDALEECRDQADEWDIVLNRIRSGQSMCSETANLGKRKWNSKNSDNMSSSMNMGVTTNSEGEVEQYISALKARAKDLRKGEQWSTETLKTGKESLELKMQEKTSLLNSIKRSCIRKRNETCIESIRRDFGDGIREADDAAALDRNSASFGQDKPRRDYEKIKASLSVFTISSRAYQKLNGMMQNVDFDTSGYADSDDTGIPALQDHAKKLTEAHRNARCREILSKLHGLLLSIACWVTGHDMFNAGLDPDLIRAHLGNESGKLRTNLDMSRESCSRALKDMLQTGLYSRFDSLVNNAVRNAPGYAKSWFAPKNKGGLAFAHSSFKALCKREGIYAVRGRREIDLQQELAKPIHDGVQKDWNAILGYKMPFTLLEFSNHFTEHLKEFHQVITKKYEGSGSMGRVLGVLERLNASTRERLSNSMVIINKTIESHQRNASRAIIPPIAEAMEPLYKECMEIQGTGSKNKMITAVKEHINDIKRTVFRESVQAMHEELRDMERSVEKKLQAEVDAIHEEIHREYLETLLRGTEKNELSAVELKLKEDLSVILRSVDSRFRHME